MSTQTAEPVLDAVIENPESKEFQDLRDRAAYVRVTGTFPTHLRSFMMSLLRKSVNYHVGQPTSLDKRSGSFEITPEVRHALALDEHPMVSTVQSHIKDGYRIFFNRDLRERRPFTKVLMYRQSDGEQIDKITVQSDGSLLHGWA